MNQEERLLSPDVAKGFAITLVVLSHLTSKHYPMLIVQVPDYVFLLWLGVSDFLAPIRMPLFFAISGFSPLDHLQNHGPLFGQRKYYPCTIYTSYGI